MANLCHFQWLIRNPNQPWRKLEATFFHGSPTTTQWRVTLLPVDPRVSFCRFSFSLEFDERFEIKAEKVRVRIKHNDDYLEEKETPYEFNTSNRFTYEFQSFDWFYPQTKPHFLHITVDISLPGIAEPNEPGNGLFTSNDDLKWLSDNLKKLCDNSEYSNMNLMSSDGQHSTPVHSYILAVRWNNFFKRHAFQEGVMDTVETGISEDLLSDILTYMYSGQFAGFHWPNWTDAAYTTELFQVIDLYKLYHFYKVFVKSDLKQLRETSNHVLVKPLLFPLKSINDRPLNSASNTRQVNLDPGYRLIFQIRGRIGNRGPRWLSYSLQSKSLFRVSVKVTLEVVKKLGSNDPERVSSFHERHWVIDPNSSVKSKPILFLGCPETFDPTSSDGTEIKYSIRCHLNVNDGTTVIRVRGVDDFTLQNDLERFRVLSDHMHELRTQLIHQDMTICSRPLGPGVPDEYRFMWPIHKGIFDSRVPDYWKGLLNDPPVNGVPDFAISTLSNETLFTVLDYLYTGKVFSIPIPYLAVIEKFAERTMCYHLTDLVNRIDARWIDR